MNKPQRTHEYIIQLLLQKRNQLQHKLCPRWNMIIKNSNNQNNVNRITLTTLSRPKGRAQIPTCSQLKCSSPGQELGRSHQQEQGNRLGEPDSGQRMETESVTRMQRITFTHWSVLHKKPRTTHDGDQAADSNGIQSSVVPGRLGHGQPHGDGRGLCSEKVQLFARRSQLRHRPLPVTLWEGNATGTKYRRTLRQILLEVKN